MDIDNLATVFECSIVCYSVTKMFDFSTVLIYLIIIFDCILGLTKLETILRCLLAVLCHHYLRFFCDFCCFVNSFKFKKKKILIMIFSFSRVRYFFVWLVANNAFSLLFFSLFQQMIIIHFSKVYFLIKVFKN